MGIITVDKRDFILLYLSISLLVVQFLWIKDIRQAEYQRGRAEILEVMAEQLEQMPYTTPKKGHTK